MTTIPGDNWEMLTEVSSTALTIGFVIAVALYVVTYLSFVRLLRYPRNWCSPSLPLSLTTAGLVTITVSYVSVSSDGLDPVALAVSAGLIAVLFSIIAAPAVAFRPAPRWVEFLAKHGGLRGPVGARTCHRRLRRPQCQTARAPGRRRGDRTGVVFAAPPERPATALPHCRS